MFLDPCFKLSLLSEVESEQIQEIVLEGLEETCPAAEQELGTQSHMVETRIALVLMPINLSIFASVRLGCFTKSLQHRTQDYNKFL